MATQYLKTRRDTIEKWTDEDHARCIYERMAAE
jgi:hypothetical protein